MCLLQRNICAVSIGKKKKKEIKWQQNYKVIITNNNTPNSGSARTTEEQSSILKKKTTNKCTFCRRRIKENRRIDQQFLQQDNSCRNFSNKHVL